MRKLLVFLPFFIFWVASLVAQSSIEKHFSWEVLATLPPSDGETNQPGLAGAFSGVHNGAMIVAGGANFPKEVPWEGGEKVWHDEIFVLEKKENGKEEWMKIATKLPKKIAYGVSISIDEGLLCIGGCNAQQCASDVYLLRWNPISRKLNIKTLAPLPKPLGFMGGALADDRVYVVGGQEDMKSGYSTNNFFALDLNSISEKSKGKWEVLPSYEGVPRILPVVAAQGNGLDNCLYLWSGRNVQKDQVIELLYDGYRYNPKHNIWKKLADTPDQVCMMGAVAVEAGASHIFILGGADGKMMQEIIKVDQKIKEVQTQNLTKENNSRESEQAYFHQIEQLEDHKKNMLDNHPGFSKKVWSYYTITDSWTNIDNWPYKSVVTSNAFKWNDDYIIASGETSPGIRTPEIYKLQPAKKSLDFGWMNYLVLFLYFAVLLYMGFYFSGRQKSTEDYFKGGGRIPWWAAGLSIFGTVLSAITFMAIPAKTFATDWSYLMYNFSPFFIAPIIIGLFLPFFHRLNLTTAYEYLEQRFNLTTRLLGSISFIVYQLGRIGIVLYLPAIALNLVTGVDILLCIGLMGVVSVIYTMLGGIEGVIWTDVVQVIVLMGGALVCLVLLLFQIEGGAGEVYDLAKAENKFNVLNFTLDWKQSGFWVVLLGGIFSNIVFYGTDQTVVQRYLTATNLKDAERSVWTNAILVIPATLLFFIIGTVLFVYYKNAPEQMQPGLEANDAIFPWYIVSHLPQGISGLLIAGVFAASMSSLSSSMNSVATAYVTDFHQRFKWKGSPLKVARYSTLIVGLIGTAFAILMATSDIKSLWDEFIKVVGLITGGLGGLFVLGMISKRANAKGALIGLLVSAFVQYWVALTEPVHLFLFTATGFFSCLIVGYLASFVFPSKEDVDHLTI